MQLFEVSRTCGVVAGASSELGLGLLLDGGRTSVLADEVGRGADGSFQIGCTELAVVVELDLVEAGAFRAGETRTHRTSAISAPWSP